MQILKIEWKLKMFLRGHLIIILCAKILRFKIYFNEYVKYIF